MTIRHLTRPLITAMSLALATSPAFAATVRTVYQEEFDGYGDAVEVFNQGATIAEWPASLKSLWLSDVRGDARKTPFPITTPPATERYTFSFAFKFGRSDAPHAFQVKLYFDDSGQSREVILTIDEAGSRFGQAAAARPAAGRKGFLNDGNWNQALIAVQGRQARLFLCRGGLFAEECTATLPAGRLTGYNFASGTPVGFDSIRIVENATHEDPYAFRSYVAKIAAASARARAAALPDAPAAYTNTTPLGSLVLAYRSSADTRRKDDVINLALLDGTSHPIRLRARDGQAPFGYRAYDAAEGVFKPVPGNCAISNLLLMVSSPKLGRNVSVYTRPCPYYRYNPPELTEILAHLEAYSVADNHTFEIALHATGVATNYEVWVDARFAGHLPLAAPLAGFTAALSGHASSVRLVRATPAGQSAGHGLYLPLDVNGLGRPFGTLAGKVEYQKGAVPFLPADPANALNLALCRENLGSFALECNGYLQRSAFDGMPSSMHFAVPTRQYIRAHALCAVAPDAPADFLPVVTARLTQFRSGDGRSEAVCDTTVRLPAPGSSEPLPANVRAVGKVGNVPLYQVAFDFDVGAIQDVVMMQDLPNLDFEFLGPTYRKDTYYLSRKRSPDYDTFSSVQVLAATLERSPVDFVVLPARVGSTYYPDEQAGFTVRATPVRPGDKATYTVTCTVTDRAGQQLDTFTERFSGAMEHTFTFRQKAYGPYNTIFTLADAAGKPLVTHRARFALLPPDTRKAGYDAPYYSWNFNGAHGTPRDIAVWGDMLKRMGVHRTNLGGLAETNELARRYQLTMAQFPQLRAKTAPDATPEQQRQAMIAQAREHTARYPHCKAALIFHESGGGGPFPAELLGGTTTITPEQKQEDEKRTAIAREVAEAWRAADPSVRIVIGNTGESVVPIAKMFREKLPHNLIDAMGEESVGMTMPPELSTAYPAFNLRRLAEIYGYTNVMPEACFEWKSRVRRHFRPGLDAAFIARDALIAHAWRFRNIPVVGITEMANSYYDTIWGYGAFSRWPLAYPNDAFSATATITLVLDRATFVRQLPTGSPTLYALEFKRDNSRIYALWSARGEADVTLDLGTARSYTRTAMCGAVTENQTATQIVVDEEPLYLTLSAPLAGVRAALTRRYPHEQYAGADAATVAAPLATADEVVLVGTPDPRIESTTCNPSFIAFFRPGAYSVAEVADNERGACIELTLATNTPVPYLYNEYTFLKLGKTAPVAGEPSTISVWVRGNSSWGKIFFEVTDAEGEKWFSAGSGGYGCVTHDWPGQAAINFDGWHFVQFPITAASPVKIHAPGENQWQWQHDGADGNKRMDFPIRVTGLGVAMHREVLKLTELVPVTPSIRLQNISVF